MENCNLNLPQFIGGVQKVGKSMHALKRAAEAAKITAKKSRKMFMDYLRADRITILQDYLIEQILEKDPELLCGGCELQGTFCEGARCGYTQLVFFERDEPTEFWRKLYVHFYGKRYYNLSLRNKLKLIKP